MKSPLRTERAGGSWPLRARDAVLVVVVLFVSLSRTVTAAAPVGSGLDSSTPPGTTDSVAKAWTFRGVGSGHAQVPSGDLCTLGEGTDTIAPTMSAPASALYDAGFAAGTDLRALPAARMSSRRTGSQGADLDDADAVMQNSAPAAPTEPVAPPPTRHFLVAAGEVASLELIPWTFNRYATDRKWARISTETVRENFRTGLVYDHDSFPMNQFGHPYHGSLYFNAARSNGYGYWTSGAFALAGSAVWECCMERTSPSKNDLVNTTLGGMTRGEVAHRLSAMIRDSTASGAKRFWRELAAALVNPVGAFNRLVRGETTLHTDNPEERFPQGFAFAADLGYRRVTASDTTMSQGSLSMSARYGDPFAGDIASPFDTFWAELDLNTPGGTTVTRLEERGLLRGWDWSAGDTSTRHIFGFTQEYAYIDNEAEVFGAEMFGVGLLSRYEPGQSLFATTDLSAIVIPLAGVRTTDVTDVEDGRTYDYAPGGGLRVNAKLLNGRGMELVSIGYTALRVRTVDGVSDGSRLSFLRGIGRIPLSRRFGIGAGYSRYARRTTYPGFTEPRRMQSEWRAFANFTVGASGLRKPTT